MRLVLWDVDLTLIQARGLGREIYRAVFPRITGVELSEVIAFDGRTELDIIDTTLRLHGLPADDETVERLTCAIVAEFRARSAELRARAEVLPGVEQALKMVAADPGTTQTVLTGNLQAVARIKLAATDLADYMRWEYGAFGDDHAERAELVRLARARAVAVEHRGIGEIVVVGDTPHDVAAARAAGARPIGVATGRYGIAELRAAGAATVLPDLSDPDAVRAVLLNGG